MYNQKKKKMGIGCLIKNNTQFITIIKGKIREKVKRGQKLY